MAFRTDNYKIIGMKQDPSESAFDKKYSFENKNIRIDNRDNNTLLSIENERGNRQIRRILIYEDLSYTIVGTTPTINELPFIVIGKSVIDKYVILFGVSKDGLRDYILRLEQIGSQWYGVYLFNSTTLRLNFNIQYPIECLSIVETKNIIKTYWVDGLNVSRVINIVDPASINATHLYGTQPILQLKEDLKITKLFNIHGQFPGGKIQYTFTYYNDTQQETNIIEMSELFDCTKEKNAIAVGSSDYADHVFEIKITNIDPAFKYLKIYRLFYSGLHSQPTITSLPVVYLGYGSISEYTVIDDYTQRTEESVDLRTNLMQSFIPYTLSAKDNTLFYGNIKYELPNIKDIEFNEDNLTQISKLIGKEYLDNDLVYQYKPINTTYRAGNRSYKGFKKYNWYKLGFVCQYMSGEWSDVIYLDDKQCTLRSQSVKNPADNSVLLYIPNFSFSFTDPNDIETLRTLYNMGYRKIKPVCVLPSESERVVVAQGILTPTVYLGKDRIECLGGETRPFAKASWFFRPTLAKNPLTHDAINNKLKIHYYYTIRDLFHAYNTSSLEINDRFVFNPCYREYRHEFGLPPKDRINAELESSDSIINAYFVNTPNPYKMFGSSEVNSSCRVAFCDYPSSSRDFATFEDARVSIDGYRYTNASRQIKDPRVEQSVAINYYIDPDLKYKPTGYNNTYYVDESIFTFNSPEVDYLSIIDYVTRSSFESFELHLNVCGSSQITGSYFNKYSEMVKPSNRDFEPGASGLSLFEVQEPTNDQMSSIKDFIRKRTGVSGYNPLISGPWWFEWILALGFVSGYNHDNIDEDAVDEIYNPIGMTEHDNTHLGNYMTSGASGKNKFHLRQSYYGQLTGSRSLISTTHTTGHYNLIYYASAVSSDHERIIGTSPFAIKSNEYYPNTTDPSEINILRRLWAGYGLLSYRREFNESGTDGTFEETSFSQNVRGDYMIRGIYPAIAVDNTDTLGAGALNYTNVFEYGCHIYNMWETIFPHGAFDSYYPHIIYPFMGENRNDVTFNGNSQRYSYYGAGPQQNITNTLLYSKLTLFNTSLSESAKIINNVDLNYYSSEDLIYLITDDFGWCTEYSFNAQYYQATSISVDSIISHRTRHLMPALKWYRGFRTLKLDNTLRGPEKVTNFLTKDTVKNNIFCSGHLPQIYRKHGSIFHITIDPDGMAGDLSNAKIRYVYETDSDAKNYYRGFDRTYYAPTDRILGVLYKSTPHIFSTFKRVQNKKILLPTVKINTIPSFDINYNDTTLKLKTEYYLKEFSRHTKNTHYSGFEGHEMDITNSMADFLENSLYPFDGVWIKSINDCDLNINLYNGQTATFWEKANSKRYECSREIITLDNKKLFLQETEYNTQINQESLGFLHIGEYINVNNFSDSTSPLTGNIDSYLWLPAGDSYNIESLIIAAEDPMTKGGFVRFTEGDIYFQRYNCLKTTGYDEEQTGNSIVELASVFLETYINLDGRSDQTDFYDNRHQYLKSKVDDYSSNLNTVHSKTDDYITYRQVDYSYIISNLRHYPTRFLWSAEKVYGEMVDNWCFVPSINKYDADGICGPINALRFFKNNIYCLQKNGISIIDYNAKAAISSNAGDEVILASSLNVNGLNYLSKSIGTSNKFSTVISKYGLYFIDETLKEIFCISDGLENITTSYGMSTWFHKQLLEYEIWEASMFTSYDISNKKTFVAYHDALYDDIYFTNKYHSIVFNEKLKAFTSFYSYERTPYMFNYMNKLYALYYQEYNNDETTSLWSQHTGNYYSIYGGHSIKFWITLLSNPDYMYDKIYNFIEFQEDCFINNGTDYSDYSPNTTAYEFLDCENEYQHTQTGGSSMKQRFNLWRMNIGRDTSNNRDRMRGAWCKITLSGTNRLPRMKDLRSKLQYINVNYTIPTQPPKEL